MHGSKPCVSERRAFSGWLPTRRFFPPHDSMPSSSLQPFAGSPKRDRLLVAAFHSPTTASVLTDSIPGSTIPACYFASHDAVSTPVRLSAPRLARFAPDRPLPCLSPLPVPGLARPTPTQSPLPFRTFTSLWIKAFNCVSADWPAFRFRPISSRSPFPALSLDADSGSSFQVRYVPGGSLFLKPLGTSFTMLPKCNRVNSVL
jgi:hypothetical protein